ncbi:MAG: hypothetical protein QOJ35_299 [Solirubrobacteraceae bacterium]|nr:hypothetical protein [Solirubrobacteraceae bacterium]
MAQADPRVRMPRHVWPLLLALAAVTGGCGSSDSPSGRSVASRSAPPANTIVGRWETLRTCNGLLQGLEGAGLRPLAAGVLAGDYFPGERSSDLAKKADVCQGAEPQRHSHFFTDRGAFGSLDQNLKQVDDGSYRMIGPMTLRIGSDTRATFRFRISSGNQLTLEPVISDAMKRRALAHPLKFSAAGWAVAVAYPGHTWERVNCEGRC